ncbi:MAG TPA: hypothetical protein VEM36_01035 [Xanthobacteraceae bacterium]|nr:hypothetical protein [Xanthobacteraceae bacterium]
MDNPRHDLAGWMAPSGGQWPVLGKSTSPVEPAAASPRLTINHNQTRLPEDVIMQMPRFLAFAVILFALAAAAPAPAGSTADTGTCGLAIHIQDPGIRASFERFERTQSAAAARICAFHRNDMPVALALR